jgi:hypothetical protein
MINVRHPIAKRCFLGLALTLAFFASACAPELNWWEIAPEAADGLKAMFPCKPERQQRTVRWPGISREVNMQVLSCQAMDATWALSYAPVQDVTELGSALRGLAEALRNNLVAASGQSAVSAPVSSRDLGLISVPHMTPHPDARGWQHQAERPDGLGRPLPMDIQAWHFSHGLTVFQATVWRARDGAGPQSGEDVANTFFRGFQFPG